MAFPHSAFGLFVFLRLFLLQFHMLLGASHSPLSQRGYQGPPEASNRASPSPQDMVRPPTSLCDMKVPLGVRAGWWRCCREGTRQRGVSKNAGTGSRLRGLTHAITASCCSPFPQGPEGAHLSNIPFAYLYPLVKTFSFVLEKTILPQEQVNHCLMSGRKATPAN